MMLSVGDVIEIRGRQATICYTTEYNGDSYLCVAFLNPKLEYGFYKYKYENKKLMVSKVIHEEELTKIMEVFISEGLDQYGLPEELVPIIDKCAEVMHIDSDSIN